MLYNALNLAVLLKENDDGEKHSMLANNLPLELIFSTVGHPGLGLVQFPANNIRFMTH